MKMSEPAMGESESQPARDRVAPTAEQIAERAKRANKATRGALAAVLCLEAFCVLLVPRAIVQTSVGLGAGKTWTLVGFAILLIVVGFMLRRPWGIAVGSILQLGLIAGGVWTHAFYVVAVLFIGIWLYVLNIRRELVGTPGGWRMLIS